MIFMLYVQIIGDIHIYILPNLYVKLIYAAKRLRDSDSSSLLYNFTIHTFVSQLYFSIFEFL